MMAEKKIRISFTDLSRQSQKGLLGVSQLASYNPLGNRVKTINRNTVTAFIAHCAHIHRACEQHHTFLVSLKLTKMSLEAGALKENDDTRLTAKPLS